MQIDTLESNGDVQLWLASDWRLGDGGVADEAHTAEMQMVSEEEDGNIEGVKGAIATRSWQRQGQADYVRQWSWIQNPESSLCRD